MSRILTLLGILFFAVFHSADAQNNYWQQEVDYMIDVRLDDEKHLLHGAENFIYHNKSPKSLDRIYIHLWPNAYRDNHTAFARQQLSNRSWDFYTAPDSMRGYIDSLDFKVNGQKVRWEYIASDTPDVAVIWLDQPLAPGERLTVSTPFRVKLPGDFSRMGHTGQQYQITQWYPKPAVFDATGWHYMPYLDLGEFYSEFGSFEVTIRVPDNYKVIASGNLQTASERLWLDSVATATAALDSFPKLEAEASGKNFKALRYTLERVHDFAWFAGKDYYVKKSQVKLPNSGRLVTTHIFFEGGRRAGYWSKATEFVDSSVYYYSKWIGDYPYDVCSAVQGALSAGGGMEYPTVTVISAGGGARELDNIIAHEVGHNWFYGILGSNERDYPWLDEGVNSYYEARYMKQRYGPTNPNININLPGIHIPLDALDLDQLAWLLSARRGKDARLWDTHSHDYDNETYGTLVYKKTALQLNYLAAYLGQEEFDRRMQTYFSQWKFKHPQPADFRASLEKGRGDKPTAWWFEQQMQSAATVDYRIRKVKKLSDNNFAVKIAGLGNTGPFTLSALDDTGGVIRREWYTGHAGVEIHQVNAPGARSFAIDTEGEMPLYMRPRSYAKVGARLPAVPGIGGLLGLSMLENKLFLLPVMGANTADGFMLGAALYSSVVLPQDLEYALVPMYGFSSKTLAGSARIRYNWHPTSGAFGRYQAGITARKYETFGPGGALIQYYATAQLEKANSATLEHNFSARLTQKVMSGYNEWLPQLSYKMDDKRLKNPWSITADLLLWQTNTKSAYTGAPVRLSVDARHRWHLLPKYKMHWENRLFAGYVLNTNPGDAPILNPNGTRGREDFLGDEVFFDRGTGSDPWSRQIRTRDAGMRVAVGGLQDIYAAASSVEWVLAYNTALKIPKIPFELFADLSLSNLNSQLLTPGITGLFAFPVPAMEALSYDAGIALTLLNGAFKVNLPFVLSESLRYKPAGFTGGTYEWHEQISFSIDLIKLNPYDLVREFKL